MSRFQEHIWTRADEDGSWCFGIGTCIKFKCTARVPFPSEGLSPDFQKMCGDIAEQVLQLSDEADLSCDGFIYKAAEAKAELNALIKAGG